MFDALTRDELYKLHSAIGRAGGHLHRRMMHEDGTPRIPVLGDTWKILGAACDELSQMLGDISTEIDRREAEAAALSVRMAADA